MTRDRNPADDRDPAAPLPANAERGDRGDGTTPLPPSSPDDQAPNGASDLEALAEEARAQRESASAFSASTVDHSDESAAARPRGAISRAPAEGERSAVVGYLGQYELAAWRTLAAIREETLVSVWLADFRAGQVDDFQLGSKDRVDAHQVKWSLHPGSIGYAEFTRDAGDRTRYMGQLADGWERLSTLHHPRRVVVHFVTNDVASSNHNPSIPTSTDVGQHSGGVGTWSFAAFISEAWRPAVEAARKGQDPIGAVPAPWIPAMDAFAEASGLGSEAWRRFIADCELEFNVPSVQANIASAPSSDAERSVLRDDTDRLAHAYMRLVARADGRVEFSRDELLDQLGWRYRGEFAHTHEFPDPEIPYRSISQTAQEVSGAIERFAGGYVAVVGSPGSGKSTLLTRGLRTSPHRVVRYYAYVPHATHGARRGEASNFLHDLTIALGRIGLRAGATLPFDNDLDLLIERVQRQLSQAHTDWSRRGVRTIILVDGLDHIPREQRPTQSLLSYLPDPEDVPDGVLFLLGSQTDRLEEISSRIREHLDEPGRRITMGQLERQAVLDIVEETPDLAPIPTLAERDRIFTLSDGHPLALNYIINRLRQAPGVAVTDVLDAVEPFSESIDRQYAAIWGAVEDDVDLAHLLALLARTRGPVRDEWIRPLASRQAFHTVTTRLGYLFRREHNNRRDVFHNSFRAFLIERTRDLPALGGDSGLFAELGDRCATTAGEPESADELYYRAQAGQNDRVLELAEPEAFRAQFVAGRSATRIRADLALALDAAVEAREIVALTRILLCGAEFVQREYYAESLPLAETWLELGDVDLALGALREGASLRTSRSAALRGAAALDEKGFPVEAREVFTLAEPLDVLRGTGEGAGSPRDEVDVLDTWIAVAPRFRPVSTLLDLIQNVRATADPTRRFNAEDERAAHEAVTISRQCRLRQGLAIRLDELGRWEAADEVREALRTDSTSRWWFWTQSRGAHDALAAGDRQRARDRFTELDEAVEQDEIPASSIGPRERIALANGYIRIARDHERARRILEGVEQPALVTDAAYGDDDGWRPFEERFALNRALGALGDRRSFHEIIPDPTPEDMHASDAWAEGRRLTARFERGVLHAGRLAGRAWAGDHLSPSDFEAHARPLVRLFPDHPQLVRGGYIAIRGRRMFYTLLIGIAAAHSSECVSVLRQLLEAEWSDERRRDAWPDPLIRTMLTDFLAADSPRSWVRTWLERIEPTVFHGEDLESELAEAIAQAQAWAEAGDVIAARTTLKRALGATFGNEPKDDQLCTCLRWAVKANEEDPAQAPERLRQMGAAVLSLDGAEAQGYVAPDLLEAGIAAGAPSARALVEWALRNDVQGWVDALTILICGLVTRAGTAAGTLSACYRSLVMPFARSAAPDPIRDLAAALRDAGDTSELDALIKAVEVVALGSTRPALRTALEGRTAADIDPTGQDDAIDAFEGLSLTLAELQARVQTISDVEDLAERLKPEAYSVRWELILAPFLSHATADELAAVAAAIPHDNQAWKVLADIAERLMSLGDASVRDVVEALLESSHPTGWWQRFDGGSRLIAYELLVRISAEEGRHAAWEALRNDIASGQIRHLHVFRSWERIVAMLAPDTSTLEVWEVISKHVAALMADAPEGEALVVPTADDPGDASAVADAINGLVASYLDHHAYALAQGAQQFFVDRLLARKEVAEAALKARLADVETPNRGVLLVLRAVARARGEVPASMREALSGLRKAPSYPDRRLAVELVGTVEGDEHHQGEAEAPSIHPSLPAVFSLVHPPAPPPGRPPPLQPGEMLERANDAAGLVFVFRAELDLIASWAGVQPEALYQYVAENATPDVPLGNRFAFDEEPDVRDELRRMGLEIGYRRPRTLRVQQAMAEATAMLIDHGRLDERHLPALDRLFRSADSYFMNVKPVVRPSIVSPIPERVESRSTGSDWTTGVTANDAVTGRRMATARATGGGAITRPGQPASQDTADVIGTNGSGDQEWIVLAEETWLRWLDWKLATETRIGARLEPNTWARTDDRGDLEGSLDPDDMHGDRVAGQQLNAYVENFSDLTADEYLSRARASSSIVVRNSTPFFETPAACWLALNPALGERLGWHPAEDGLFRWLDSEGRVRAESVWWQDGFAQHRPPLFDDEVGYGWLVCVSRRGWQQISTVVGECVDWCRVARLAHEQQPTRTVSRSPVVRAGENSV